MTLTVISLCEVHEFPLRKVTSLEEKKGYMIIVRLGWVVYEESEQSGPLEKNCRILNLEFDEICRRARKFDSKCFDEDCKKCGFNVLYELETNQVLFACKNHKDFDFFKPCESKWKKCYFCQKSKCIENLETCIDCTPVWNSNTGCESCDMMVKGEMCAFHAIQSNRLVRCKKCNVYFNSLCEVRGAHECSSSSPPLKIK